LQGKDQFLHELFKTITSAIEDLKTPAMDLHRSGRSRGSLFQQKKIPDRDGLDSGHFRCEPEEMPELSDELLVGPILGIYPGMGHGLGEFVHFAKVTMALFPLGLGFRKDLCGRRLADLPVEPFLKHCR
jgi:hypothetical protein